MLPPLDDLWDDEEETHTFNKTFYPRAFEAWYKELKG